ncbi:hypothetical protein CANARDRAFT_28775 [[Candida] arabinofermentans NRRL YB-2248]|uniref:AMP-dependent synthetase/ligase domain-containing protein n=1 Tax=[Candida] arabinofermentans NRRL YB-2248 TaxID=983967 RepID=A0A1E4SZV3_9ASCO|nr:hypothetical protein CANARDRAFT_28775 [[Candida] arabinofermentans NRRL YB-2248]
MVFQVNVPVGPAKPGETAPRRFYKVKDAAVSKPVGYNCTTLYEFFYEAMNKHGKDKPMQAWRDLIEIHFETKKVKKVIDGQTVEVDKEWMFYEQSDYKYMTFGELEQVINNFGKGLVKLGVEIGNVEKFHIFASTSAKWMRAFLGCQTQAIPIVTAYDTLGEQGLTHSLVETDSVGIFTDNDLLIKLVNPLKSATKVRYIIHSDEIDPSDKRAGGKLFEKANKALKEIKSIRPDIQILSYNDLLKLGSKSDEIKPSPPKPDDLACIMYTSGSTGTPKGVVLSQKNIVAGLGGISVNVPNTMVTQKDRVICFLPLAHIFELAFELIIFYWGGIAGYASVKTLTDASTRNSEGDMKTFKPTIMVGVAAVWEAVKKGIMTQIEKAPPTTQKIFWAAYKAKVACKKYSIPVLSSVIDSVIFKKIKAATGGEVSILLNGGSPISGSTQRFISTVLAPMLIGYGLTETVANTCIGDIDHFEFDVAGALVGSVTVKLIDVKEAGYEAKNNQGEVLIKGLPVMSEYYKNEKETKDAFNYEENWFSTGDIGEWTSTGQLKIIDRKKNLVKTQNGEYIALEKLESVYRSNKTVLNICCYADENKVKPIAIVVPNEVVFKEMAIKLGLAKNADDCHLADLMNNKKLTKEYTNSLIETGKSQGLAGIELILGVVLTDEEWTPESGYVTSAQKLQRKKILASVQKRVDALYADNQ